MKEVITYKTHATEWAGRGLFSIKCAISVLSIDIKVCLE